MTLRLNLGCGKDYKKGFINIDFNKNVKADIYLDFNKERLPFTDNSVDFVYSSHLLEHLVYPEKLLREIERVLKPGKKALVIIPHWNCFVSKRDLTHKRYCTSRSFDRDLQEWCYQTSFNIERIEWVARLKTIMQVFPLKFLEAIGYPIYQLEFWLVKK